MMATIMKRWGMWLVALGVVPVLASPVAAQTPGAVPAAKPGAVEVDVVKVAVTVEAVDKDKRTVTVKAPAGGSAVLKVNKAVKNFDQIQVGDKVAAEYVDATAIFVRKAGAPPHVAEAAAVEVAAKGQKPAGLVVETVELTARVENINYDLRLVTLRNPAGNARTIKVARRVENLRQVKVGDELVVRHTEALAITVLKAGS
jgi:hypothetical protein